MSVEQTSFEEAFARLEETVRVLEGGELSLAQMVATYEEAVKLCGQCTRLLDEAELRVSQLVAGEEGVFETTVFDLRGAASTPGEA